MSVRRQVGSIALTCALAYLSCSCRAVAGVGGDLCVLQPDAPSTASCGLVPPQCGCEEGEACVYDASGGACVASRDVPIGQSCAELQDCVPGASCLGYGTLAICSQFCTTNDDCGDGSICLWDIGPGGHACTLPCNPARPADRCGTAACDYVLGLTICRPFGPGGEGAACAGPVDCQPGLHCMLELGVNACDRLCGDGLPCPLGERCVGFLTVSPPTPGTWGHCF